MRPTVASTVLLLVCTSFVVADETRLPQVPDLQELLRSPKSEFADIIRHYEADRGSLQRTYTVTTSSLRTHRLRRFHQTWLRAINELDSAQLSEAAKEDRDKLLATIRKDLALLDELHARNARIRPMIPFADTIENLEETRRRMFPIEPEKVAGQVNEIRRQIAAARETLNKGPLPPQNILSAVADATLHLRNVLRNWFNYYNGYDPLFTWWLSEPYKDADSALGEYHVYLRDKLIPAAPSADHPFPAPPSQNISLKHPEPLPDLPNLLHQPNSEIRTIIQRFAQDRAMVLGRRSLMPGAPLLPRSLERLRELLSFYQSWRHALAKITFDQLSLDGQIDYVLLQNHLDREISRWQRQITFHNDASTLLTFEAAILEFVKKTHSETPIDELTKGLKDIQDAIRTTVDYVGKTFFEYDLAAEAARRLPNLKASLAEWYDKITKAAPAQVTPALRDTYRTTQSQLDRLTTLLREKSASAKDESGIDGRPIGREALLLELRHEFIPYSPEELIAIAEKEYVWSLEQIKRASRDMGFGDDWRQALEKVKRQYAEPGKQPVVIRELAEEAVQFLHARELVTIPPLCTETWRSEMMPAPRQLYSPFFTGGEVISIAFPTNTMSHDAKIQSLRGNNIHFARATVHHELIPGHHLQSFMAARHKTYRSLFATSFWTEGNALYWEFVLYKLGFPKTPEDRIGFLIWRMHRSARVVFSIQYHLGRMTPQQCIDYLIDMVGFERDNAAAEVRRSFSGGYGPLYQLSYLIGGLQFWALRKELVDSKKLAEKVFHDSLLHEGRIPVPLLRAKLQNQKIKLNDIYQWRFYNIINTSG
jgi:hypothetical protein